MEERRVFDRLGCADAVALGGAWDYVLRSVVLEAEEREREREGVDIDTFCGHVVKDGEFLELSLRFDVLFLVP